MSTVIILHTVNQLVAFREVRGWYSLVRVLYTIVQVRHLVIYLALILLVPKILLHDLCRQTRPICDREFILDVAEEAVACRSGHSNNEPAENVIKKRKWLRPDKRCHNPVPRCSESAQKMSLRSRSLTFHPELPHKAKSRFGESRGSSGRIEGALLWTGY